MRRLTAAAVLYGGIVGTHVESLTREQKMQRISFPAVAQKDAHTLVLGSMPGEKSLLELQYYAHPRNLFWLFVAEAAGVPQPVVYDAKLVMLKECGIAVWDVLSGCERAGSLDASIVKGSEQVNDIAGLVARLPRLQRICFNGKKAYDSFIKLSDQRIKIPKHIELLALPSTSPANASISFAKKQAAWVSALSNRN